MTHPYDQINDALIANLRTAGDVHESALLATHATGYLRNFYIGCALDAADKVTAAAAKLREEIDAIEAAQALKPAKVAS